MKSRVVALGAASALLYATPSPSAAPAKCRGMDATIIGTGRADRLVGTAGRDVIVGRGGNDEIFGREGPDVICGGGGRDVIRGNRGHDLIFGGPGADELRGGKGRDSISGGRGFDELHGGAGTDVLAGNKGDDVLRGKGKADLLDGGDDDDLLVGNRGKDVLVGGAGRDRLDGSKGFDLASAIDSPRGVTVYARWQVIKGYGKDHLIDIEMIGGSTHGDTMVGSSGKDILLGDAGPDLLRGRSGDDILAPGWGSDVVRGGAGADTVDYILPESKFSAGPIVLDLADGTEEDLSGTDELHSVRNVHGSAASSDMIRGDARDNTLISGYMAHLVGREGNDTLVGGSGTDVHDPGAGNDTIRGKGRDVVTYEDAPGPVNIDLQADLATGWGTDSLAGVLVARGSAFDDVIRHDSIGTVDMRTFGGAGNDLIEGSTLNHDSIDGGPGDDVIRSAVVGPGTTTVGGDAIRGGDGNDEIVTSDASDGVRAGPGDDDISTLGGDDEIHGEDGFDTADGGSGEDECYTVEATSNCEIEGGQASYRWDEARVAAPAWRSARTPRPSHPVVRADVFNLFEDWISRP